MLLARRWSKVAAVLFAVGAVSGTVLTFELGILWPHLMGRFGAAFGFPFAIEGIFFFLEAIFVSIYIYGWDRMRPWAHFWSGVPVALSGIGGSASVIAANSWMNKPGGITLRDGSVATVRPAGVFFNGAFWYEFVHMFLAAYIVAGFTVAGVYARGLLRRRTDGYHRKGFLIGFGVAGATIPLQIVMGDFIARYLFHEEPRKFATIEMVPHTDTHVPETLLGILKDGQVRGGLGIPSGASLLAGFSPSTRIRGLNEIPPAQRPTDSEVSVVHLAFDIMVGTAFAMLALAVWFAWLYRRRREVPTNRAFLWCTAVSGIVAVVSLECGWVVTEVGRQPFTVVGLLLTRDAVATHGNLWPFFAGALAIYLAVALGAALVLRNMKRRWHTEGGDTVGVPYGPREPLDDSPAAEPRR
jgi:cytochrome d ubiquinol oxidase subunit I